MLRERELTDLYRDHEALRRAIRPDAELDEPDKLALLRPAFEHARALFLASSAEEEIHSCHKKIVLVHVFDEAARNTIEDGPVAA